MLRKLSPITCTIRIESIPTFGRRGSIDKQETIRLFELYSIGEAIGSPGRDDDDDDYNNNIQQLLQTTLAY